MPTAQKPPRLWLRKREGRKAMWLIKDGGQQYVTGCGEADRAGAENALAEYIASKWKAPDATQNDMSVSDVLSIYGREHGATTADPARIGYAIDALLEFWADQKVSDIRGEACRTYDRFRGKAPATVRRELGTLRAALRYCETEGYLRAAPAIWLPEKPPSKDRWLTREEAARLLAAARAEGKRSAHLVRFILIGLYTGTRKDAILNLGWSPNLAGGHVDLENGVIYRQSASARRTKKRQSPVRIPRRLFQHLSRWQNDGQWVIEYSDRRVLDIKRGWNSARDRAGLEGVTPHVLRHTAITWAMQRGARIEDASVFFAISMEELQRTYWHHHPDAQGSVIDALDRR